MNAPAYFALLIPCFVIPAALVSCHPAEKAASGEASPAPSKSEPVKAEATPPQDGTLTTSMPPEEVFRRALWRHPAPDDKILHAERREWTRDSARGVDRWQWFLAVEPGEALKKWLREQNPFSVHPAGLADAPEIKGAPGWFPAEFSEYIIHTGGSAGSLVFLWSRKGNTLFATASGTGFAPGAPEPPPVAPAASTAAGRLPLTPPPNPSKQ